MAPTFHSWKKERLGEHIFRPDYGYTESATDQKVGPKFLRITDIQDGNVAWESVPYCRCDPEVKRKYLLESGDIVIARIGATTGKAFLIENPPEAVFASYLIRVRAKNDIRSDFLNLSFQTESYRRHIDQNKGGRLKGGVSIPILQNLTLPIPPLPEQRAIARALRAVQGAREARLREVALEKERKAALMEHLFACDSWNIAPLEKCAFVQTGVTKGRKFENGNNIIKMPYLRVANVQDGYLDLEEIQTIEIRESELERFLLQPGDILLTEGGDFDKLGRGFIWQGQIPQCVHQNHIFAVRVDKDRLIPEYLAYLIQSEYGKAYFLSVAHRTTHLACINSTKLKAFPTLIPDLAEQKRIVDVLAACDSKIAALDHEARLHDELFLAMLEELMCGRLSAGALVEEAA